MTQTLERPHIAGPGIGDGAQVIVKNDNHNTFEGVAMHLSEVIPSVSYLRGMKFATQIHNSGQAIVFTGEVEEARGYHDALENRGLTMGARP